MTTVSVINPEVVYNENEKIDEEDLGYKTQVYELDIPDEEGGSQISVVLGKPKYTFTSKNIVFFPIYAVHRSRIRAQIGVFEVESTKLLNVYKSGEVDTSRLSPPLFYSFSKPGYLARLDANPKLYGQAPLTPDPGPPRKTSVVEPILDEEMREDCHLDLSVGESRVSTRSAEAKASVEKGVFDDIPGFKPETLLEEETKEMASAERKEYKESARNTWIEKYMRNNQYRIHEVESNGDCFFAVVRDAFADLGKKTTVDKLREILVAEMTDEIFHEYRQVFLSFAEEIRELKQDLNAVEKTLKAYKTRAKQNIDLTTADTTALLKESKAIVEEKKNLERKITETEALQKLYTGNLDKIDTLEKMRRHIATPSFWADAWSISTLERVLNVKFILFSEAAFEGATPDMDGVLLCSEVSKELQERQSFSPDHYIMATYSGDHYRLISYKSRKIFQFREVPYDVKILVLNRCLARMSGAFYMIQDFRNWKTKFGIDEDEGAPDDYDDSPGAGELFQPETQFVFSAKARSAKPGKATGEKILAANVSKYAALNKEQYEDWRRILDDEWDKTPIVVDGHKWTSVAHYMQGVQYKRTHPDVYMMFSLDSDPDSKLAKDVKAAKAFKGAVEDVEDADVLKGKKTKEKKKRVIAPDMDFDDARRDEERLIALKAKFSDNADLRIVLKMTRDALLLHKEGTGIPPVADKELMRVRQQIMQ